MIRGFSYHVSVSLDLLIFKLDIFLKILSSVS